jgi:uncharacterized membrane protein
MDRITAIRKSLTAFVCGLFGLVPVLGFVPAVCALVWWRQVRKRYREPWNPAASYLTWGAVLGAVGLLASALVLFVFVLAVLTEVFD